MNITYNELEKSIEIKDDLKKQYLILKGLMLLNLINALLNLYDVNDTGIGFMEIIWMLLGLVSIGVFYIFIVKKSTLEHIPVSKIKHVKVKSVLGRKRVALVLNNGKQRDLNKIKTQEEFNALRTLFSEIGIKN